MIKTTYVSIYVFTRRVDIPKRTETWYRDVAYPFHSRDKAQCDEYAINNQLN